MYADVSKKDVVLEIGSGVGNLTKYIAEKAGKVIAVEKDKELVKVLREELSIYNNVEIVEGDFLKIDLPKYNKVVSNIPFSLSSEITERILMQGFDIAVILYQKEFAYRLIAKPGSRNYSRITILAKLFSDVEILEIVSRRNFYPVPDVDSAIVRFRYRGISKDIDIKEFFEFIRKIFIHKKKSLRNALKLSGYNFHFIPEEYLKERVYKLNIDDLIKVYKLLA